MYSIKKSAGQIISADTQDAIQSIDNAIKSNAMLCASIVDVNSASGLPVTTSQPVLDSLVLGLSGLVQSRQSIADATRDLVKIQRASTLKETAVGCPGGLYPLKAALDEAEETA